METIGTLAQVPKLAEARDLARTALQKMKKGTKPLDERRTEKAQRLAEAKKVAEKARAASEERFELIAARFLKEGKSKKGKKWSASYAAEVARIIEQDVKPTLGKKPVREITKQDINNLLDAKASTRKRPRKGTEGGATIQANRVLMRLRRFFAWAAEKELIDSDPTVGVKQRGYEQPSDRILSLDEIVWFWRATEKAGWPHARIFQLLLLTAQREGEVSGMRWSELDLEERIWTIPKERAKNQKAHIVHLSDSAIAILNGLPRLGDMLFPTRTGKQLTSFSRAKRRLDESMTAQLQEARNDKDAVLQPWVIHDLRRTATTVMAERLKVAPHVADKILNHSTGTIRGVAAIYNRSLYLEERQAALGALGRYVSSLVQPGGSDNVVPLRGTA